MHIGEKSQISIPNCLDYIPAVQAFLVEAAGGLNISGEERSALSQALGLTLQGVIQYAYEPSQKGNISVSFELFPSELVLTVHHDGRPSENLDSKVCRLLSPKAGSQESLEQQLCTMNLVDEFSLHNLGPRGNEIALVRRLGGDRAKAHPQEQAESGRGINSPGEGRAEPAAYSVGLLAPDQAVWVSRSAYEAYGYTYADTVVYYPDRLREMNRDRRMVSAAASTRRGEIMGHAALWKPYPHVQAWVLGMAFVRPKFRGRGCLREISRFLLDQAREMGLPFVCLLAVSGHVVSQKISRDMGFKACGIFLADWGMVDFRKLRADTGQRQSSVLQVKLLSRLPERRLFAPAHLQGVLEEIYQHLGIEARFCPSQFSKADFPAQGGRLSVSIHEDNMSINITILSADAQTTGQLRRITREQRHHQTQVLTLWLNLTDPATPLLAGRAMEMGYAFSGMMPDHSGADRLILENLDFTELDFNKIHVLSKFGSHLLDYIKSGQPRYEAESGANHVIREGK